MSSTKGTTAEHGLCAHGPGHVLSRSQAGRLAHQAFGAAEKAGPAFILGYDFPEGNLEFTFCDRESQASTTSGRFTPVVKCEYIARDTGL